MQPTPIQWKRSEFHTFYAQMKIRVGGVPGMQVDILAGDSFEFDGTIVKYAGSEFPQPGVRGAVKEGWATMDEEGNVPAAFVPDRPVAKSQSINRDLSRVQRHQPRTMDSSNQDEDVVLEVGDRNAKRDPRTGRGHIDQSDNRRKTDTGRILDIQQSDFDEQDATPISQIKSPAKLKVDVIAHPGAARDIENRTVAQGYGRYAGERRNPRSQQDQGSQVVEREGVTIKTNVGQVDRNVRVSEAEDEGVQVGTVRHTDKGTQSRDGVTITDTSGTPGSKKGNGKSVPATVAAKSVSLPANASPKLKQAVRLCSDFPVDWNFFGKSTDKIAKIKELGSGAGLLDALCATESPKFKKELEKSFPKHFS